MLNYDLSDEHRLFQGTVREFAEGAIAPVAEELDRTGRFPLDLVAAAAELGLMGIPIPAEWGGAGADTLSYAIAIEELARIDQSFAITVAAHTSLGTTPILRFGGYPLMSSSEQKARRKGLMVGVDLRFTGLEGLKTIVMPTFNLGYEAF